MTTRLTDQVLANIHGDMRKGTDIYPRNNQLVAEVLNRLDEITVGGYDADACAAVMFAFGSVIGSHEVTAPPGATAQDVNGFLATMATLMGQALHAQTHAVAQEPEPEPATTRVVAQVVNFDTTPWPDQRASLALAIVGDRATAHQIEALRQYRAARGLSPFISVVGLTAAEVNQAVTWWNHRAAMLEMEQR